MKYAGGIDLERMAISRSSSWPMVNRMGAGETWVACSGDGSGAGRAAGLFAANTFKERKIARPATVNVFTRDAPERRIGRLFEAISVCLCLANLKFALTHVATAARVRVSPVRCVRAAGRRHTFSHYCLRAGRPRRPE